MGPAHCPLPLKHTCRDPGRHDDGLSKEIHQCNTIGKPALTSNTCKVGGSVLDTTRREMGIGHDVDCQAAAAVAGRLPHTLRVLQAPIR